MNDAQTAPPPNDTKTGDETRRLFEDAFKNTDGVVTIDLNRLREDAGTAIEVAEVLGGKVLDTVSARGRSFLASLRQHVGEATAEVKAKRAAKPADSPGPSDPPNPHNL